MAAVVQAIPTTYKGLQFRSRTEARWAVFFDHVGVTWQYEPEGYHLDGVNYIPDFWMPQWNRFLEIKGNGVGDGDDEKIVRLAEQSGCDVIRISGGPYLTGTQIQLFKRDSRAGCVTAMVQPYRWFAECECSGLVVAAYVTCTPYPQECECDLSIAPGWGGCGWMYEKLGGHSCVHREWEWGDPMMPFQDPHVCLDSAVAQAYRAAQNFRYEY